MRIHRDAVAVEVPATSANLGPGFDSLGLALELRDRYSLRLSTAEMSIEIHGEGEDSLPRDDSHLVVRAIRTALDAVGAPHAGLQLTCHNVIPHGRGLGSSAAAIVGGLALGRALLERPEALSDDDLLELATEMEGHPDNVAPAIVGGVTLGYMDGATPRVSRLAVGCDGAGTSFLDPVIVTPRHSLSTSTARSLLPQEVPFNAAAFNASRAALFVHAIANDPSALMAATEDRLHQDARAAGMPESVDLVHMLRAEGIPAVISGAGPTVLIPAQAPATIATLIQSMVADPAAWQIARASLAAEGVRTVLR